MAPESTSLPKRKPSENQYLFNLGVRGRKTGITLPDTGIRDENGLELIEHIFSSPDKTAQKGRSTRRSNGGRKSVDTTISSEEDMDVGESTIPEPTAVLSERKRASLRLPPPRSKSPIKTFLKSSARRNPSMGPVSSPTRGSIVAPQTIQTTTSVRRKLDFSTNGLDASDDSGTNYVSPRKRQGQVNGKEVKVTNGVHVSQSKRQISSDNVDDEEQDVGTHEQNDIDIDNGEDSYRMMDAGDDGDNDVEEDEPELIKEPEPQPAKRGRPRTKVDAQDKASNNKELPRRKRGRPSKKEIATIEEEPAQASEQEQAEEDVRPAKRPRCSEAAQESTSNKTGRTKKPIVASKPARAKASGRKPRIPTVSEVESPQIQRGPAIPRSKGLFIIRRETPVAGPGFQQTRSGRNSIKPVAYWKNERIEYSEDENEDNYGKFVMPRIKEVVRADEVDQPKRPKVKSKASKSKKRITEESDDEEEAEPWETEPGNFVGEVCTWDPEDPTGIQAELIEDELAWSSAAIVTRDIANATFKFAKTLTLPFFGSGMVDLPPGSMKKPKNSRKMQMVFFVFYGRVRVTVNESTFRIGKGGMWQVPRANFYSIENDYDKPARIFFSQGCEVQEVQEEPGA